MNIDKFELGLLVGIISTATVPLLVCAIAEIISHYRHKNYRPRFVRSTYKPQPRRRAKHRAGN